MRNLLATKINIPRLSSHITLRDSLLTQLNAGLDKKLILLCAPAGFGKTTLLTQWIESLLINDSPVGKKVRIAWYTLDETDNNLATFVGYLAAALQKADLEAFSSWVTIRKRPHLPDPEELAREVMQGSEFLDYQLIVALDDYHFITDKSIHQFVNHCLRFLSSNVLVAITTRQDPPLNLSLLRARNQVIEFRTKDLAFTLNDTRRFFLEKINFKLDAGVLQTIWERTEGWAAGLQLASIPLSTTEDQISFIQQFQQYGTRYIMDYLVDEVLHSQQPAVHNFLLQTSILSAMCSKLCGAILEIEPAVCQDILDDLYNRNLFIVALDDHQLWYRYHKQFHTLLHNHLQIHYTNSEIAALHNRAADWYARQNAIIEALRHFIAADSFDGVVNLIVPRLIDMFQDDRWEELSRWLAILPKPLIDQQPELLLLSAWLSTFDARLEQARQQVEKAEKLVAQAPGPDDKQAIRGQIHALRCSTVFTDQPSDAAIMHGNAALELLPKQFGWARAFTLTYLTQWLLLMGNGDRGLAILEDEIRSVTSVHPRYLARLYYALANLHFLNGDIGSLAAVAFKYENLANVLSLPAEIKWSQWAKAWVSLERNQLGPAMEYLHAVFSRPELSYFQTLRLATYALLRINEIQDCTSEILTAFSTLRTRLGYQPDPTQLSEVEALDAIWAWQNNNLDAVEQWVNSSESNPLVFDLPYRGWILVRLQLALYKAGRFPRAIELVNNRLDSHRRNQLTGAQVPLLVELARAYWYGKQPEAALASLRTALELGYPRGLRNTFSAYTPEVRAMLKQLAQQPKFSAIAADLLGDRFQATDPGQPDSIHQVSRANLLTEPLSDREAEILQFLASGLSNKEIAVQLHLSPFTVRNHITKIFHKLHITSRRQAIQLARKSGFPPSA